MKALAFLSQKGGSGKSTLAVHTAVAANESGQDVLLLDLDPQRSATTWGQARGESDRLIVLPASAAELPRTLEKARTSGVKLVIIDTAPHTAPDAAKVASLVDLVVIPVRPSAFDLAAVPATRQLVEAIGAKAVAVLSACPPRSREIEEARQVLSDTDGTSHVYPGQITDRRAFARAVATGQAVTEFESDGKAAEEIRELWAWLRRQLR